LQKRAPPKPRHDLDLLRSIVEALEDSVIALDAEGKLLYGNAAAEELLGLSATVARGRPLAELGAAGATLAELAGRAHREGRVVQDQEMHCPSRAGVRVLEVWATPRFDPQGRVQGSVLLAHGHADPLGLAEGTRGLDRHAIYATLAAGLAHEVRNPLGGIRGAVQLLQAELDAASPLREYAQIALREVDRLSALIERLLDLGRTGGEERAELNLHQLLDSVLESCRRDPIARGATLVRTYDPSLPLLWGDSESLRRLFYNLLRNALEATEGRGRITVSTRMETGIRLRGRPPHGRAGAGVLRVTIADDGPGIPTELQARLFLPFATTKAGGTGLGLALARKVAVDHGGWIVCASQPGQGTAFSVYLPVRG
jgi:two-component system nitrogen regulation sensor histidine kinase GlnL